MEKRKIDVKYFCGTKLRMNLSMIPEREAWEEEAAAKSYQEAQRRIRVAKETGAVHLDLTGLKQDGRYTALYFLDRLPPELARLGSLL